MISMVSGDFLIVWVLGGGGGGVLIVWVFGSIEACNTSRADSFWV